MIRLTREQSRAVDALATDVYQTPGIVLMENAARGAVEVAREMLRPLHGKQILILCGGGNNGGDGLAMARHLHNHRAKVTIAFLTDPATYKGDALINARIIQAMKLPTIHADPEVVGHMKPDLVIDAIFGTGLNRRPSEPFGALVEAVQQIGAPILAIDVPSGLDCDTGKPLGACIRAKATATFVAEKVGFAAPEAAHFTGEVTVVDIGCPRECIDRVFAGI
jgi:NAD(P)H-hydrate epimerase